VRRPPSRILFALLSAVLGFWLPATAQENRTEAGETLEPGQRGVARTAIRGSEIEEIPLEYLGTLDDYIGPGHDLHIVRLEGAVAEHTGVAAGMSGSPVYIDGKLIGALSYRLGSMPRDAVAGVTPISNMLEASRSGPSSAPADLDARPIRTPVSAGGLAGQVKDWLGPHLEPLGMVLVGGAAQASSMEGAREFEPGSPVGVALALGDMTIAAAGTVTLVDRDTVYAFGHPFLSVGRTELPMLSAEVIHTLADGLGSFKLTRVGEIRGAIVEDRLSGIVGRTGAVARMIPLELNVSGASFGEQSFRFEIVNSAGVAPSLIGALVANALIFNLGYEDRATMLLDGTIELVDLPDLPLEMAYSGESRSNPAMSIAGTLRQTLSALWANPLEGLDIRGIKLNVRAESEVVRYTVESLVYDRGPIAPGQSLDVGCVLRRYRGETTKQNFSLVVPEDLAPGSGLFLAIGAPDQIERALGHPVSRRVTSSESLKSVIRALGDWRSQHRLTAVLYQRSRGVVARGEALPGLPPTAEHLLSRSSSRSATSRTSVAALVLDEIEMDGPVEGGLAVKLRLDTGLRAEEVDR